MPQAITTSARVVICQNRTAYFPYQLVRAPPVRSTSANSDMETKMDLNLTNKLALVSGSTAGIGFAIAHALASEGARVIVNGRTQSSVNEAIERLKSKNGCRRAGLRR